MGLQHRLILASGLLISLFASIALARDVDSPSLSQYPDCAAECIVDALHGDFCAPSNQTCLCTDQGYQKNVTTCVTASCTIPEALAAMNSSLADCGAPTRDRSQQFVRLSTTFAVLAAVFVAVRFGYKIKMSTLDLGIDDWLVLASLISFIPTPVITAYGTTPNGLGKDIWTLTPHHITTVTRFCYFLGILYFTQTMLVKLCIIGFYIRIFTALGTQRLLWGTFVVTTAWGIAFIIFGIFPCIPISYFWHEWDGLHKGKCASSNAGLWSHAGFSVALDLWILAVPLWQLQSLQLHWKKKLGVAIMFTVGTLVTIVSIVRFRALVNFGRSMNKTWELYNVSVWSTIEITVGIICACLPTIRVVLVTIFPILSSSSTQRSRSNRYYDQNSSPQHVDSRVRAQTVATVSADRPNSDEEQDVEAPDIVFHKTYGVRYSESDEISLVPMRPPGQRSQ
ncbi:CFEM domain-containing protein [Fusarium sp. LHS14.1]|nr:CFEM domain-containing protein [Fusarium sp. LHS14.1]